MKLKIVNIVDELPQTIHTAAAEITSQNGSRKITSGNYSLDVQDDAMSLRIEDEEKEIEAQFSPFRATKMNVETEYGTTQLDIVTSLYDPGQDVVELKYHLMSQGQQIESFHFKFEIW